MEQLEKLIDKLNTDPLAKVSIYDNDKSMYVCTSLSHEKIKEQYSCAEDYFEKIYADGHTNLTIQERRKSGNSIRSYGSPFEVSFGNQSVKNEPKKEIEKTKKSKNTSLSVNEIIDLKIAKIRAAELEKINEDLKSRLKKSKRKHKILEREKLTNEFTVKKSDSFNNMLLGAFQKAPLIMAGLGMKVPIQESGLGASFYDENTQNYSETKIGFLDLVKTLEDDSIELLNTIYKKVTNKDDDGAFADELVELLKRHNMIII